MEYWATEYRNAARFYKFYDSIIPMFHDSIIPILYSSLLIAKQIL